MPSILNSDDGVVSGTSGLKTTGGNDGLLNIQSNGSTVVAVTGSGISVTGTVSQTGVSTFAAGTVSAPSITFTGDTNTGIFSPAADTIAFTEGGTEAMRIDSSGNVLVGVSSLNRLGSGSNQPSFSVGNAGTDASSTAETYLYSAATASGRVVGSIAFGTSGASSFEKRSALIVSTLSATSSTNVSGGIEFYTNNAGTIAERMRIDSSGNVGIGRTPTYLLDVNGTARFNTTIGVGNTIPAASGAGITFPATQSASSDANTLDDYEEGTWTPTDQSGAGLTFTIENASYTKIGRLVTAQFSLQFPSTANGTRAQIGGLPFTIMAGSGRNFGGCTGYISSNPPMFGFHLSPSTTQFETYKWDGTSLANSAFSGGYFRGIVIYYVD